MNSDKANTSVNTVQLLSYEYKHLWTNTFIIKMTNEYATWNQLFDAFIQKKKKFENYTAKINTGHVHRSLHNGANNNKSTQNNALQSTSVKRTEKL